MTRLLVEDAALGYQDQVVCPEVSVAIPDGRFTVIVGPNACGKSTLLKSLTRLLAPSRGNVLLDGQALHSMPTKRYPHQSLFTPWSPEDERAVAEAMDATGVRQLSGRLVDELSGGQRQRVWMAVALAQQTPILLLDEPTTYLDLSHQIDLLELCRGLNRTTGHTLVAVLHDLNQAARYADHIIAMHEGTVVQTGTPAEVITEALVADVFGLDARVIPDPESGSPLVVPRWRH